ncbi:hypothetical protein BH20CHL6_BH20CHL6_20190 [soil metagenome]
MLASVPAVEAPGKGEVMRARTVLLCVSLLAGIAAVGPAEVQAAPPDGRPDIMVILVDDLAQMDNRVLRRLPNIRSTFLKQGVRFSDFHVETPLCCPGRAGFLSGLHTYHHRVDRNDVQLFDPRMTIATELQASGYQTFLVGKYFNRYETIAPEVPRGWDHFHALAPGDTSYVGYYEYDFWNDGRSTPEHRGTKHADYSTDAIRSKTVSHLRATARSGPRFGWITPFAPHGPTLVAPRHRSDPRCADVPRWSPPHYNEDDVSDKPAYVRGARRLNAPGIDLTDICGSMLAVDDLVGKVREELAAQGRLDETLLILTSDNGMNMGAHRLQRKSTPYATDIPFLVSWPAGLGTAKRTISELVSNIDLAPTLCEIAGCTMGPYPNGPREADGLSFAPLLFGEADSLPRREILNSMPLGSTRLDMPGWHGLRTTKRSETAYEGCASADHGGCRWQYVSYESSEEELYDLSNGPCWTWTEGEPGDPCALDNLAGDRRFDTIRYTLADRLATIREQD